jgi:galactose mutarotase-like enzyme
MGIPLLRPWVNRLAGDEYRVNATTVSLAPTRARSPATSNR